jgi:hypothetical protein
LIVASVLLGSLCLSGATVAHAQQKRSLMDFKHAHPFGIGLTVYNQTQPYEIASLEVQFPGFDPSLLSDFQVENNTTNIHVRFDYWILPFFNIFGLIGDNSGTTRVNIGELDLGLPVDLDRLTIDTAGTTYGIGAVLAFGGETWFTTLAYDYTESDLDVATSSVRGQVVAPKFGLRTKSGAVWVGAMYQEAEEKHEGIFDLPFVGAVPFKVELNEAESWNYLLGATTGLSEHWVLILQAGFGERKSVLTTLQYRL